MKTLIIFLPDAPLQGANLELLELDLIKTFTGIPHPLWKKLNLKLEIVTKLL